MPVFEKRVALKIVQTIKAFLNVEAEASKAPGVSGRTKARARKLKQAGQRVARKGRTLRARARRRLGGEEAGGIRPENVVWIFGSARTGSTWLSRMMGELEGQTVWREPLVGELFGHLCYVRAPHRRCRNFVLGGKRETWLPAVRSFCK